MGAPCSPQPAYVGRIRWGEAPPSFYTIRNQGAGMVLGLERWQEDGDLHFVTFSCYQRCAYLGRPG